MSACVVGVDVEVLPTRAEAGVYRSADGDFFVVAFPCVDEDIALVALSVVESRTTTPEVRTVVEVRLDPPVLASALLVSLDPDAERVNETLTVFDPVALDRFRHDDEYLVSVRDEFFFGVEFFDPAGKKLRAGQQLAARFDTPVGMVGLASGDYGLSATCPGSDTGWTFTPPG